MDTVDAAWTSARRAPAAGRVLNCEDITNLHMAAASARIRRMAARESGPIKSSPSQLSPPSAPPVNGAMVSSRPIARQPSSG